MTTSEPILGDDSDEDLVRRAGTGDKTAFAVLHGRHRPTAAALVNRLLERREDVDDVLQESAVQTLVCLGRLRDASKFGPWFCGVALNLARQQLRDKAKTARWPPDDGGPLSTEELVVEAETAEKVRRAIDALPLGQREAVRLFYLDGLNELEVATELGVARSAVKSRLHKARQALRGHLQDERRPSVAQLSLIDVDVTDVRREPAAAPGSTRNHVVILRERDGQRFFPIFVGEPEGRAMASAVIGRQTPRPMTYQMAASLVAALSGSVPEVRVVRFVDNAFIAEVAVAGPSGTTVIDARPSDAINLALLTDAPVRVSAELFEEWALRYEHFDFDEYGDDASTIGPEFASKAVPPSLDRFSPDAMAVLTAAREEAHDRSNAAVGTGHILLALLRNYADQGTRPINVPVASAEDALNTERRLAQPKPDPPFTPRSCQVLARAERRAQGRPDPKATPDDLLAALLEEPSGLAARVIAASAVDREALRASPRE